MSIWKRSCDESKKPWGSIIHIPTPFGMDGKIIHIDAGKRTSLKYYKNKNQALYCFSGSVAVIAPKEYEFGDSITPGEGAVFNLKPGDLILIQAGDLYRAQAMEDSILVEVLLGQQSDDFVMVADDFGRVR